jgi:beta-ureidopropionase / N-carbamoyl-L-amino-acid hydrolase
MMRSSLPVDGDRVWQDVMALAAITEPEVPYTRRSFTAKFAEGRRYLAERFAQAGLIVRIDTAGNLIGRYAGRHTGEGTILIGSHSDTVPGGGRFDGIAGLAAALEVARKVAERRDALSHDLEVIDFLAEEVSVFRVSCVGSRAMAGQLPPSMLDETEPGGETLRLALLRAGGDPARLDQARRSDIAAFLELHIEQGPLLETERQDVGVVRGLVGITRVAITVQGRADHAGTTPMTLRHDALSGAVEVVRAIRDQARARAGGQEGYFVATVGELSVKPNAANVVPSAVRLLVDIRAEKRATMESFLEWMKLTLPPLARTQGVTLAPLDVVSDALPVRFDAAVCDALAESANALGLPHRDMVSGAGHDAAWIAQFAPASMIFIPCRDGRSHAPEEWTEPDQLAAGTAAMLETVLRIDRTKRN